MDERIYSDFLKICHRAGWKCTSQRLAVYDFLYGNKKHPDVDDVWDGVKKTLPAVTRESVYRILNELSDEGVICRIDNIESARYDSRIKPHGHFICAECGTIFDFDLSDKECISETALPGIVNHFELRAVGICEKCAGESSSEVPGNGAGGRSFQDRTRNGRR